MSSLATGWTREGGEMTAAVSEMDSVLVPVSQQSHGQLGPGLVRVRMPIVDPRRCTMTIPIPAPTCGKACGLRGRERGHTFRFNV